ncbi:squalene--hopene cyclase [Tepidibacillus sp. HK-1]|uniref:squalene--hopene cyclase n=1 Tax=Tepidibacillus sp. HK-1 TaxID=1883407 RepID=UPI00085397BE|nr:squalene--hopene cyclase [Tepidibacillus sp. HK-1]GBF10915.1 sporulenol synthase [Tepidibacillus sp. HK-1]
MINRVNDEINRLIGLLEEKQASDGAWYFCFENGIIADAYLIILLRSLEMDDEALIQTLVRRIKEKQTSSGTWKIYHDQEEGDLSATVEAYYSLLYSGYVNPEEPKMIAAKQFIIEKGGLSQVSLFTKVMLAFTGQYHWPENLRLPIELILLPPPIPFNIFDFVGYARVHFVPIMIGANKKFSLKTLRSPNLSELYLTEKSNESTFKLMAWQEKMIENALNQLSDLKNPRELAFQKAEEFLLNRIENDGTLYSYFTATFVMIFALLALGYSKDSKTITKAVNGLKSYACKTDRYTTIQNSPPTIWDTALISYALQEAGVPPSDPMIVKANQYLLAKQRTKYGDWRLHNPRAIPGGWGFSPSNTINPDIDDTTVALRAIQTNAFYDPSYLYAWQKGAIWTLSMQNQDGGWPAFEKNTNKKYTSLLPIKGVESVTIDPSHADLTGRTLEFLGNYAGLNAYHPSVQKGIRWLFFNQERNGSWYGRWGINYIYGTWAAITGLKAVGIPSNHPRIQKAIQWLLSIQKEDGGWGESCISDAKKQYVPLQASTPSQTAWAVDALIAVYNRPTPTIQRGIQCLIDLGKEKDWRTTYPTGAGFPGNFYILYHSYRYIWPLLALSHYRSKFL